jgi:hypothetical protein
MWIRVDASDGRLNLGNEPALRHQTPTGVPPAGTNVFFDGQAMEADRHEGATACP